MNHSARRRGREPVILGRSGRRRPAAGSGCGRPEGQQGRGRAGRPGRPAPARQDATGGAGSGSATARPARPQIPAAERDPERRPTKASPVTASTPHWVTTIQRAWRGSGRGARSTATSWERRRTAVVSTLTDRADRQQRQEARQGHREDRHLGDLDSPRAASRRAGGTGPVSRAAGLTPGRSPIRIEAELGTTAPNRRAEALGGVTVPPGRRSCCRPIVVNPTPVTVNVAVPGLTRERDPIADAHTPRSWAVLRASMTSSRSARAVRASRISGRSPLVCRATSRITPSSRRAAVRSSVTPVTLGSARSAVTATAEVGGDAVVAEVDLRLVGLAEPLRCDPASVTCGEGERRQHPQHPHHRTPSSAGLGGDARSALQREDGRRSRRRAAGRPALAAVATTLGLAAEDQVRRQRPPGGEERD